MVLVTVCKIYMVIVNIFFLLVSLAFAGIGAILVFVIDILLEDAFKSAQESAATSGYKIEGDASQLKDFPLLYEIGVALLVFGIILFFLSLFGCFGSCCASCCRVVLLVFAVVLFLVMVAEITVFSLFLVKDSTLHTTLKDEVKDKITTDYDEVNGNAFTSAIIIIHQEADCCGMDGVGDFGAKQHQSCDATYETTGCYNEMQDVIQDNKLYAGLIFTAFLVLQLLQILSAVIISKDAKSKISPF